MTGKLTYAFLLTSAVIFTATFANPKAKQDETFGHVRRKRPLLLTTAHLSPAECVDSCGDPLVGTADVCISTGFYSQTATVEHFNCLIGYVFRIHNGVCTHDHVIYPTEHTRPPKVEHDRILCGRRCSNAGTSWICATDGYSNWAMTSEHHACLVKCQIGPIILRAEECPELYHHVHRPAP
ncbi:uncharacterized protein LOC117174472 [Belonocnema kinseyi]|uniref:uncharacterized protein LOC117174472 n=1 Tax=Belonocnema kinseyi TaxID=2817044 RepID=UPI00143DDBE3|nr:uncharacterized protein LOC117174472 [Belonocnema kinseyi]